jgi:hypothetical protein
VLQWMLLFFEKQSPPGVAPRRLMTSSLLVPGPIGDLRLSLFRRMTETRYREWLATMAGQMPDLATFLHTLPFLSITYRKALLQMARVGVLPCVGSRVYERMRDIWDDHIDVYETGIFVRSQTLRQFVVLSVGRIPLTPVFSGFLSSVIRSAPHVHMNVVAEEKRKGIAKELRAAMEYKIFDGDYRPLLGDSSHRSLPVFSWLPGNETLAASLHLKFTNAKLLLSKSLLFPVISKKTVGNLCRESIAEVVRTLDDHWMIAEDPGTTLQIERIYHRSGWKVEGPIEVRSAWTYGNLKPRIYYAQGGTVFHDSKYIQPICNIILDQFPVVHRQNRFNPPEDELEPDDLLMIYDFSEFTSRLDELCRFVDALADFFMDTTIEIIDTRHGRLAVNLGELLHRYNKTVNRFAECDITQVLEVSGDKLLFKHTTGPLGVPGNISLSTLLHGIFTTYLVQSERKSRCIGDDGKLYVKQNRAWITEYLQRFGNIAEEKAESWEVGSYEDAEFWAYAKRPITRLPLDRVVTGVMVTFPTLETLCNLEDDGFHKFIPEQETPKKRKIRLIVQWNRLLIQLWSMGIKLSEEDRTLLDLVQKTVIYALRRYGNKQERQTTEILFRLKHDEFGENPAWKYIEMMPFDEVLLLPEVAEISPQYYGHEGETFEGVKTKMLSLLEKLGYCRSKMVLRSYTRSSCPDWFFYKLITGDFLPTYSYEVIRDFPNWSNSL